MSKGLLRIVWTGLLNLILFGDAVITSIILNVHRYSEIILHFNIWQRSDPKNVWY